MRLSQKLRSVGAGESYFAARRDNASQEIVALAFLFRRRENFGNERFRCRDQIRPKIVEIGAILMIFQPFEVSVLDSTLDSTLGDTLD